MTSLGARLSRGLKALFAPPARPRAFDPAIAALGETIAANLRALGLVVATTRHGKNFCEIIAATARPPAVRAHHPTVSGVALLLAGGYDPPQLVFAEINSLRRGLGRAMVAAALSALEAHPGVISAVRLNDRSPRGDDGRSWWGHVAADWPQFDWIVTHDDGATHRSAPPCGA